MKVFVASSFDNATRKRFLALVDRYASDAVEQIALLFGPSDGVYDPEDRTIILTCSFDPNWDFIEGTLVHELTHAEDDRKGLLGAELEDETMLEHYSRPDEYRALCAAACVSETWRQIKEAYERGDEEAIVKILLSV